MNIFNIYRYKKNYISIYIIKKSQMYSLARNCNKLKLIAYKINKNV